MPPPQDLEQRVTELEKQLAVLRRQGTRGVRYESALRFFDLPFVAVASGPDFERGEMRGHAKGIIAVGDIATGLLAVGGLARGIVAIGGLALGGITFGGLSIGALVAVGGMAIGSIALGGGAVGAVAVGGGAAGYYACGGGAAGSHTISARGRDPEAVAFFRRYGAEELCGSRQQRDFDHR